MKTSISAILAVAILANAGAFADELRIKKDARPIMWEAAVKPDVAPPAAKPVAKPTEKTTFTAPVSKRPSLPLYYSAQRSIMPPLAFNPFPDLEVLNIGDNKFVYDDRMVDYSALSARRALDSEEGGGMSAMSSMSSLAPCNPCSTNGSGGGGASLAPLAYTHSATDLWVKITSTTSNGFLLDVNNTVPGTYYGVGAKSSVDTDPFNTWSLVTVFQATSTNRQFAGTGSAAARFYNAVNIDAYVGPTVSIVSPVSGTTVSNDVPLQIRVTDILPLTGVKVYVDAVQVGVIMAGQNGLMSLPTTWFPNGPHQIWVSAVNEGVPADTDGDSVADDTSVLDGWGSVTVNFTNRASMQNYSPLYSQAGSLTLQYAAMSPHDYTFEVFKTNGTLLHTASGESINGSINRQWNFTDLSANPVHDGRYVFSLTYSPKTVGGSAAGSVKKIVTTNLVDSGVTVGKYVVSYGEWPNSTRNTGLANMNTEVSVRINAAAYFDDGVVGSGRDDYNTIHADFTSAPFAIRQATQTNDLLALTNALKNVVVGSWLFDGHSGINNMIHGHDGYLTVDLEATTVAALLGNSYALAPRSFSVVKYGRRLFSTMITGCTAATPEGWYPDAVGTPAGVDQVGNTQIKKSVFLGFLHLSYSDSAKMSWIRRIHGEWLDGGDYDTPFNIAHNRATVAFPEVFDWGPTIRGYRFLQYNANDSR